MTLVRLSAAALLACAVLADAAGPAAAQLRPRAWTAPAADARPSPAAPVPPLPLQVERREFSLGRLIGHGLLGGAVGAGLGLFAVGGRGSIGGGVRNAVLGAAAGIPVGVHPGNRRRGNLLFSLPASLAIGAAVFYTAGTTGDAVPLLAATPAAELAASILLERATM